MKEWDVDAYKRKWNNTIGIAKVNGKPQVVFYQDIAARSTQSGKIYPVCVVHFDKNRLWGIYETHAEDEAGVIEPVYHAFEPGIYLHNKIKNGFVIIEKQHRKSFAIGLSPGGNCNIMGYSFDGESPIRVPNTVDTCFLEPLPKAKIGEKGSGYIDRRWWYCGERVYYLDAHLGFKEGKKFILSKPEYLPFVAPLLDKECQIRAL